MSSGKKSVLLISKGDIKGNIADFVGKHGYRQYYSLTDPRSLSERLLQRLPGVDIFWMTAKDVSDPVTFEEFKAPSYGARQMWVVKPTSKLSPEISNAIRILQERKGAHEELTAAEELLMSSAGALNVEQLSELFSALKNVSIGEPPPLITRFVSLIPDSDVLTLIEGKGSFSSPLIGETAEKLSNAFSGVYKDSPLFLSLEIISSLLGLNRLDALKGILERVPLSELTDDESPHFSSYDVDFTKEPNPATDYFIRYLGEKMAEDSPDGRVAMETLNSWLIHSPGAVEFFRKYYPTLIAEEEGKIPLGGGGGPGVLDAIHILRKYRGEEESGAPPSKEVTDAVNFLVAGAGSYDLGRLSNVFSVLKNINVLDIYPLVRQFIYLIPDSDIIPLLEGKGSFSSPLVGDVARRLRDSSLGVFEQFPVVLTQMIVAALLEENRLNALKALLGRIPLADLEGSDELGYDLVYRGIDTKTAPNDAVKHFINYLAEMAEEESQDGGLADAILKSWLEAPALSEYAHTYFSSLFKGE